MSKADIGLVGLAVMGENLVLNMESHGFTVAVYNRTLSKVDDFVKGRGKDKKIIGTHSIEELISKLKNPRKIMLMVKAGKPVDDFIETLIPHLEKGDIIIDPFTGSSTTGLASFLNGRKFIGIDTEKKYLDLSIKRLKDLEKSK